MTQIIPSTIEQLSAGWLKSTLNLSSIEQLQSRRIGEDFGFASEIFRLTWRSHSRTMSAVAKLWDSEKVGGCEVHFYQTFKQIGCRIPNCLFSKLDKASQRGILILEDISPATQGDVLKQLSTDQSKRVAKALAGMHATPLPFNADQRPVWIKNWGAKQVSAEWIRSRRKMFLTRFPNQLDTQALTFLNQLESIIAPALVRLNSITPVLFHGDFHLDNVLFSAEDEPVILDWSRPMLGPAELNLATLIFDMSPPENTETVLNAYVDELNIIKKSELSSSDLLPKLSAAFAYKFMESTCGMANWKPSAERGEKIIEAGIERYSNALRYWIQAYPEHNPFLFSKK